MENISKADVCRYLQTEMLLESKYNSQYQELLKLLQNTKSENSLNEEIVNILKKIIYQRICMEFYDVNNTISLYYSFQRAIKQDDGSYNIYPYIDIPDFSFSLLKRCCKENITLQEASRNLTEELSLKIEEKKEDLKKSKINNYYGTVDYMILRGIAICDAIDFMMRRKDITLKEKGICFLILKLLNQYVNEILKISQINYDLNHIKNEMHEYGSIIVSNIQTSISDYDKIRVLYQNILKYEEKLIPISKRIWNDFEKKQGGKLVHQLTDGIVKSDEMDKICTSFVSNQVVILTEYDDIGNTGYLYHLDLDSILCVCPTDAGSWLTSKEEFIDCGLQRKWQLDDTFMFFECGYHTKLFAPEFIEKEIIKNGKFAEIVIANQKNKIKPVCGFYTQDASQEEIRQITEIAKQQKLDVVLFEQHPSKMNQKLS